MYASGRCARPCPALSCRRLVLAGALVAATSIAHATNYNEAVQGDLSNNAAAPSNLGSLTSGVNTISGTTVPTGTFNSATHSFSIVDNDYVTFTVPTGEVLSQIELASDSVIQPGDRMFLGIAQGSTVSVDPSFSSAAGLLGWTLAGQAAVGTDILPALGAAAPANFPAIGGATGFTGALASGQYTLWILDGDHPASYDLKLNVSPAAAVPEPSSGVMMLAGLAACFSLLRRAKPA